MRFFSNQLSQYSEQNIIKFEISIYKIDRLCIYYFLKKKSSSQTWTFLVATPKTKPFLYNEKLLIYIYLQHYNSDGHPNIMKM